MNKIVYCEDSIDLTIHDPHVTHVRTIHDPHTHPIPSSSYTEAHDVLKLLKSRIDVWST